MHSLLLYSCGGFCISFSMPLAKRNGYIKILDDIMVFCILGCDRSSVHRVWIIFGNPVVND